MDAGSRSGNRGRLVVFVGIGDARRRRVAADLQVRLTRSAGPQSGRGVPSVSGGLASRAVERKRPEEGVSEPGCLLGYWGGSIFQTTVADGYILLLVNELVNHISHDFLS